ncbi:MAG: ABC transporter permease subunit [Lachnospiraceae bacterium]|jgi:multiple sugar transport system permease protein/putative aldouronate transport system permease protein|nr:ABC transporter permease subunit [Lachnospiraceae bacterium]MDE6976716.1 ABC transporter permease subunit [Lachnospiraceae bacterium]
MSKKTKIQIGHRKTFVQYFLGHWQLYAMISFPIIMLFIFAYAPMYGVILAFKDYKVSLGIWDSPWAANHGFNNFIRFFSNYNFRECLRNTIVLSIYSMLVSMPCSIILALSLNYAKNVAYRKFVQMVSYCPYFISTIVFVGIINMIFDNRSGVIGSFFFNNLGINILGNASYFSSLYVWSGVWQGVGFGAIIYMAALAGVDQEQHEAAIIDGATLLQRIWYVDIPAIIPTAVIMLILNMGGTLNIGYEKILAMQNQNNIAMSEVISTYSYKVSLVSTFPDFPYSTAIGLFQSLVGLILILITNKIANKLSGTGFL